MDNTLITIITVTYNCASLLKKTIESVLKQRYINIEFIIIDGGSTDGTIEIIKHYENKIKYWVSEPDNGIYHAMNKGVKMSTGKWINFLNAGDYFCHENVLSDIFENKIDLFGEIIYGNFIVQYEDFSKEVLAKPTDRIWRGMVFCHQASFTLANSLKEDPFSLKYKITSDFNFFYKQYLKKRNFKYVNKNIVYYQAGGLSDTARRISLKENLETIREFHGINFKMEIYYFCKIKLNLIKKVSKYILPNTITKFLQRIK